MKKIIFFLCLLTTLSSFGQTQIKKEKTGKFGYKVGVAVGTPIDVISDETKLRTSSTMGEVTYRNTKVSKKLTLTLNSGYFRFTRIDGADYAKIPVMLGLRYPIDKIFYFGASVGPSFYNRKIYGDTETAYSPYIGLEIKKLSCDFRYFNFNKGENTQKTLVLVFSYTL